MLAADGDLAGVLPGSDQRGDQVANLRFSFAGRAGGNHGFNFRGWPGDGTRTYNDAAGPDAFGDVGVEGGFGDAKQLADTAHPVELFHLMLHSLVGDGVII
jgi:hypothetical protein